MQKKRGLIPAKEDRIVSRKRKAVNHSDLPEHVVESIARLILPDIIAYYESEEGQREFAEWKNAQAERDKTGK